MPFLSSLSVKQKIIYSIIVLVIIGLIIIAILFFLNIDGPYTIINNETKNQYNSNSTKLYKNTMFTKGISNGIIILTNGKWNFFMNDKGELAIRGPKGTRNFIPIAENIGTNLHGLVMQSNGNLVITNATNQVLWSTGTSGNSNAYLELTDIGELVINNSKGKEIYKLFNRVTDWLNISTFYNNCPNIVFSDKKGRFFNFLWTDYNRDTITNIPSDDCDDCRFRGWIRPSSDLEWNVSELDITSIDGYNTLIQNGGKPKPNDDDTEYNYNSSSDRNKFYNDGGDKIDRKNVKIFASRLEGGNVGSNYLPGYDRISYIDHNGGSNSTYKFLVSERDGWNQAFILYRKKDKLDFIDSVVENKNLIRNVKNYWRNTAELPNNNNFV